MNGKRQKAFQKHKSEENRLYRAVLIGVAETVERQLSHMNYFNQSKSKGKVLLKKNYSMLHRQTTESEFIKQDNRIALCEVSANFLRCFRKNAVVRNPLVVDVNFTEKPEAG